MCSLHEKKGEEERLLYTKGGSESEESKRRVVTLFVRRLLLASVSKDAQCMRTVVVLRVIHEECSVWLY